MCSNCAVDQRKIPLHHFTIGFQKQGICADSLFLESNGKMVQWDFSLIKNRAPRVQFPCLQIDTFQPENKSSHLSQSELVSWCAWPGVKSIARWAQKPSPAWGSIFRICADSLFLESNGKMVQWDFSLISSFENWNKFGSFYNRGRRPEKLKFIHEKAREQHICRIYVHTTVAQVDAYGLLGRWCRVGYLRIYVTES